MAGTRAWACLDLASVIGSRDVHHDVPPFFHDSDWLEPCLSNLATPTGSHFLCFSDHEVFNRTRSCFSRPDRTADCFTLSLVYAEVG